MSFGRGCKSASPLARRLLLSPGNFETIRTSNGHLLQSCIEIDDNNNNDDDDDIIIIIKLLLVFVLLNVSDDPFKKLVISTFKC